MATIASTGTLSAGTQSLIILRQPAHSTDDEPDCNDDASAIAILTIGMGEAPSMEHNRRAQGGALMQIKGHPAPSPTMAHDHSST